MTGLTPDLLGAFLAFAFVTSITPGPNNAMLLASGANFGVKATLPHWAGIIAGMFIMLTLVGVGLGRVFVAYPVLHLILAGVGAAYMLYLAVRIGLSDKLSQGKNRARPFSFLEALAFQAVNPKAWAMALGAMTAYAPQAHYLVNVAVIVLLFVAIGAPCMLVWTAFGLAMRRFLDRPAVLRAFNIAMALALALSLIPGLKDLFSAR